MKSEKSLRYQERMNIFLPKKDLDKVKTIIKRLEPDEHRSIGLLKIIEWADKNYG